jgi:predicted HTH transcriptional regulator
MKTVVVFANGDGGQLVFCVEDGTHRVVAMDAESLFQTMDAITNAVSDSCEPTIVPDITIQ